MFFLKYNEYILNELGVNMNKRQIQKEATKANIVSQATILYATEGFQVSTYDIAKQSKVSHGTIFSHFPTKEALLIFVIEAYGQRLNDRLHAIALTSLSVKEALYAHVEAIQEQEDFYIHFVRERYMLPREATLVYVAIQTTISHHLGMILEKESSVVLPLSFLFNTWMGLLHYYLLNRDLFVNEGSVLAEYKEELVETFIMMIRREKV